MWREYIKERENKELIESDKGFAVYTINGEQCYITDIFVKKEFRKEGVASQLADEVVKIAKEKGCTILYGSVSIKAKGASVSLLSQLHYGFQLCPEFQGDLIFLYKEI